MDVKELLDETQHITIYKNDNNIEQQIIHTSTEFCNDENAINVFLNFEVSEPDVKKEDEQSNIIANIEATSSIVEQHPSLVRYNKNNAKPKFEVVEHDRIDMKEELSNIIENSSENLTHTEDGQLGNDIKTEKDYIVNQHGSESFEDSKCVFKYDVYGEMLTGTRTSDGHIIIETDVNRFKCDECDKLFSHAGSLRRHKLIHTGIKNYQCDICCKWFSQSGSLKSHKLTHTGIKPYQCDECGKRFLQNRYLTQHKLIHTGIKKYQCGECEKCFLQPGHLIQHKLIHTVIKPYQCDECDRSFSRAGVLRRHKLWHLGVKQYQCEVCQKCFSQASNLKQHIVMHTGVKPYQCDECERGFSQISNLKRHKLLHTDKSNIKLSVNNLSKHD